MKLKNKIWFIIILVTIILSSVTISYARYVLNKKIDVKISVPPVDAGSLDVTIKNNENTYDILNKDEKVTISSKVTLTNIYNIPLVSEYAWTTTQTAPNNEEYTEFNFEKNESEISKKDTGIGTYYLWVRIKYTSEIGEQKEIVKTSKMISVLLGDIKITLNDKSEFLTGDVIANISYTGAYKYNTMAGYGKTEAEAIANASSSTANTITIKSEEIDTIYYIYAVAENSSGRKITSTIKIDNIDNIKPTINEITPSFARAKINISDNKSGIKEYCVTTSNTEPQNYSDILNETTKNLETYINNLKTDTDYYLWVKDSVGNVTSQKFRTLNLIYEATPKLDEWTNSKTVIKFCNLGDAKLSYSLGARTSYSYDEINGIEIYENICVNYVLQDGSNKITGSINVNNIDKIAPVINVISDYDKLTITATDEGSGIIGYFVTDTEVADITKTDFLSVDNTNKLECYVTQDYLKNNLVYNKQYYVYVKDKVGNISRGEVISKIDTEKPKINITNISSNTNTISVSVNAEDTESGLTGKYKYYIGTESGVYDKEPIEILDTRYTFQNLEHNKTYYIKVETQDAAGRIGMAETSIKTSELLVNNDEAEIVFLNALWTNNTQTVNVKTTTNYKMRYQIVKEGSVLENLNQYWSEPISSGTNITGLEHGDVLYVKLYDGTNSSSNWATYNVINNMKAKYPTLTEEQVQKITIANFNILTYSVNKNEMQVNTSSQNSNTLTYNYYMKNVKTDEYNLVMTTSTYDEKVTLNLPQECQIYSTICIQLNNNEQGTLTRSINKTTTIANETLEPGVFADENKTYIDKEFFTATVPKGFKVSSDNQENIVSTGLVMQDENNNEFVWVPVQNAIYNNTATTLSTAKYYTPMVRCQKESLNYYEKIYYSYNGNVATGNLTNLGYRIGGGNFMEPTLVTGNAKDKYTWNIKNLVGSSLDADKAMYANILGFNSTQEFGAYLNSEYTKMITSVNKNGGFLVGRYETTIDESGMIGSKKGKNILSNKNWYNLYKAQNNRLSNNNTYYNSTIVKSSMITGSQYDAMLNFILKGNESSKVTSTENYGNRTGNIAVAGSYEDDKISNVYDLISNVYEETVESYSSSQRVARSSGYFANTIGKSASTKTLLSPTDNSEAYGSRMALYLLDSTDKTPPTFNVEVTAGVNNIKVNITDAEDETGIGKYYYSISLSGDGTTWEDEIITTSNTYTFENLRQSKLYYIRVKVSDEVGNESGYIIKGVITNSMNISNDDLYIRSFYGKNPNCVAILAMGENYENSGFKIKYKVVEKVEDLDDINNLNSGTWTIGNVVRNLSDTNVIIAKLTDSNGNEQKDYSVFYLKGYSEEFSEIYSKTDKYEDINGEIAYIPKGFSVGISSGINTIENGLVIQDENGNQYVWIPVENAVKNDNKEITENYTPMAKYQKGNNNKYYEGIYYTILDNGALSYNLGSGVGSSSYREPSLVTINVNGSDVYTWDIENTIIKTENRDTSKMFYKTAAGYNSAEEFGKHINEEYYNMINSVIKYKGFYIARYETSVTGTDKTGVVVNSVPDKTPYTSKTWYYMNYYQDSTRYEKNPYYKSTSVVSSMIWNSQYNAMVNWIYRGKNSKLLTDKNLGYHSKVANTGKTETDIINNIFDLAGNVAETSMGVNTNSFKVTRGGCYGKSTNAVTYLNQDAGTIGAQQGSRLALYIVNEEDDTAPYISKREDGMDSEGNKKYVEPYAKSNSITVKVTAYDPDNKDGTLGSGISKYIYSISSTTDANGNYINYKEYENHGNTYTFSGLKQNTTYDMKVTVYDHSGKKSQIDVGTATTIPYKIDKSEVFIDAIYGTNGKGTVYIDFDESFNEIGSYHIEYQIGKNGANYNANGKWSKTSLKNPQTGVQVNNLSIGDIVYVRVTDGINVLSIEEKSVDENGNETIIDLGTSIYTFNITQLEDYSSTYETKTEYEDIDKNKATIPSGFAVNNLHKEIKDGLVIKRMKDNNGNAIENGDEFVWVPVKNAVYDEANKENILADSKTSTSMYKPMARLQGKSETTSESNYEGILYDYSINSETGSYVKSVKSVLGISKTNREISLITGSETQLGWLYKSGKLYDAVAAYYNKILHFNSVKDFGTYMNNEYTEMVESVKKYGGFWIARYETTITEDGGIHSVSGAKPYTANWYNMYYSQESGLNSKNPYYKNSDVVSTMVFGSQWDAMLNWVLTGNDASKIFKVIGNHEGAVGTTGKYGSDYINNIFDTSSNVRDLTQEANNNAHRVYRGGTYGTNGNTVTSERNNSEPTLITGIMGTRFTLYVK